MLFWIVRSDWPVLLTASAVKLSANSSPFWRRVAFARPVAPGRWPALAAGQGKAARKNPTRRRPTDAPGSGSPLDRFGQRVDRGGSAHARAKRLTVYAVFRACTPPPLPGSRSRPRQKRPAQSCCSGRAITIAGWSDTGRGKAGSRKPGIDSTQAPGRRYRGGLPLHKGFQPGDFDRMLTRCADGPRARLQLREAARPRTRNSKTRPKAGLHIRRETRAAAPANDPRPKS